MLFSILRSAGLGLGASLAALIFIKPSAAQAQQLSASPARQLTELYERANEALLRGDVGTWDKLAPLANDFVLMSPFGGKPSRYEEYTPERKERIGRFFRNGRFRQELIQSYAADGMIVLVTIERANVEVGGLPAQDWALRVTSVFTRDGSRWMLAHRHADPLVEDVSLVEAARLGRGERGLAAK